MKVASGKSADQFFQKIVQQKATLYFSAILAKKGKLNLDLNLDLHGSKNLAVLMWAPVFFCFDVVCSYMAPVLHDMHAAGF